jgi:L-alanine-DL-glutamate epimerase-like enolase superfamily enzyme
MLKLNYSIKRWTMVEPFIIASGSCDYIECVIVTLTDELGNSGRGETCGVDYHGETIESICRQIEASRQRVEAGIDRESLGQLLPAGGARNGLDCALWDLHCRRNNRSVWAETDITPKASTDTAYTIGVVGAVHAGELATKFKAYQTIKIKADKQGALETIANVRSLRPEARIIIDANQSWDWQSFGQFEASLIELDISLLEQPFLVGQDACLAEYQGPLKIAADESVQTSADLPGLVGKYDVINIKLDKTGGLTEALNLARRSMEMGFGLMVGNMCGSSLAMAPAYVIAQLCEYIDLDGPLLQNEDVHPPLIYSAGRIFPSTSGGLWAGI